MSWVCPHQRDDGICRLRKSMCKPFAGGCALPKKFRIISGDTPPPKNNDKK